MEPIDVVNFQSSIRGKYVEQYVVATEVERIPEDFSRRMLSALFHMHKISTYENFLARTLRIEPPSQFIDELAYVGWV
ncbi:hypothetical protein [Rubritalea tangerina]|uniref:hypothetical protein n=1 Tax=Rubritalea tangerina TaxID=430798 RepID=UPI0036078464